MPDGVGDREAITIRAGEVIAVGAVALRAVNGEPDRLEDIGIVRIAWENVPVKMRHLVSQKLVVDFSRQKSLGDRLGNPAHVLEVAGALSTVKLEEFVSMSPG